MAAVELHKLNGDTSWLFRLPKKQNERERSSFFNLVLDPWLDATPQIDGSPIFSRQTRVEPAAFSSLAELDQWLRSKDGAGQVDAVLLSHPFTDHLHPETIADNDSLAVLQRATIFTTSNSLSALRSLKLSLDPFRVINLESPAVRQDVEQAGYLPSGISIQHLPAKDWSFSPAWKKLHAGILISCSNSTKMTQILYSPHGVTPVSLPAQLISPQTRDDGVRVLVHSFDKQTLPMIGTVACGFPNVLDLIPTFQPDLVLATHDEHKRGEGIVGRLLRRQSFLLEEAEELVKRLHPQSRCQLKQLAPGEHIGIA